jgi:hypothetical protein
MSLLLIATVLASTARASFDLTGEWVVTWQTESTRLRIVQEGTSLTYSTLRGEIDPETGEFQVVLSRDPACPGPLALYAHATDADHFEGDMAGYVVFLSPPCRFVLPGYVSGTRVEPAPTRAPSPSPTPTPVPCAGDCDGNGRATVNEIIALVQCLLRSVHAVGPPCDCADADRNGVIAVNEIVGSINNSLHGCP